MAKTTESPNSSETTEVGKAGVSNTSDELRAIAEKGVDQSKEAYDKFTARVDDTQEMIQTTFEVARGATVELSLKVISTLRDNAEAGLSHLEDLARAQSLSEVIELQTSFLRKRAEVGAEQAKELQTIAAKTAAEVSKPFQTAVEKAKSNLQAA